MQDRKMYLGSSDCAAVLGMSRWRTQLQVWAEKTGQIEPEDISEKIAVRLGNKLEQTVAELFMEETGKKVVRVNEPVLHKDWPFLRAQIDRRVIGEDAILECKTCSAWKAKEWEGQEIPQEYILQCYHQLAVTGKAKAYIAVLIGNQDFKWKEIPRSEKVIDDIVRREVEFWEHFILAEVMPFQISANDSETLQALFPEAQAQTEKELADEANRLCEELDALHQDKKSIEGSIDQKENELKAMIGDFESGKTSLYTITWKNQKTTRIDTKRIKDEAPDIFEKYSKTTNSRVLRIRPAKGDD
jgi:putative phage-type endonuclease